MPWTQGERGTSYDGIRHMRDLLANSGWFTLASGAVNLGVDAGNNWKMCGWQVAVLQTRRVTSFSHSFKNSGSVRGWDLQEGESSDRLGGGRNLGWFWGDEVNGEHRGVWLSEGEVQLYVETNSGERIEGFQPRERWEVGCANGGILDRLKATTG